MTLDGFDNNIDPLTSDCWGAIADYDSAYNDYELSDHEYVVYEGRVFYPETDVNADVPELGNNLSLHDPRNYNLKKHMVRLAVYELTKLIAPNNVSAVRMRDYEDSMKWLNDAAKLRLNPQIPRKVDETKSQLPIGNWLHSRTTTTHTEIRGWCRLFHRHIRDITPQRCVVRRLTLARCLYLSASLNCQLDCSFSKGRVYGI